MVGQRALKVAGEIQKEVSEILNNDLKDPGIMNMISVTGVEVSRDLSNAKVFVSVYSREEEQEQVLKILEKARGFIRSELGKRIRIRHIPEIEFKIDRSIEYGAHIERVLKDISTE